MTKAQKQSQQLEYHKMLIQRLDLETATKNIIAKKDLKRLARYYKHSYKDTLITAKRMAIRVL